MKVDADIGAIRGGVGKYLDWLEQNELAMWDVMPQATQGDDSEAVIDFVLNVVSDTLNIGRGADSTALDATDPTIRAAVHDELTAREYLGEVKDFQRRTLSEVGHKDVNQAPDKLTDKTTGIQEMQMSPPTDVKSDEERKDELLSYYSDEYKSQEGIRPRWIWKEFEDASVEEVEAALDKLYDYGRAKLEREDAEKAYEITVDEYDFQDYLRSKGLPYEDEVHPGESSPRGSGMGRRAEGIIREGEINNPEELDYDSAIEYLGGYNETDTLQHDMYITDAEEDETEVVHAGMSVDIALRSLEDPDSLAEPDPYADDDLYTDDPWMIEGPYWEREGEYLYDEVMLYELMADQDPETGEWRMENNWYGGHDKEIADAEWITPQQWMERTEYDLTVNVPLNIRRPDGKPFDEHDPDMIQDQFRDQIRSAKRWFNVDLILRPQAGQEFEDAEYGFS